MVLLYALYYSISYLAIPKLLLMDTRFFTYTDYCRHGIS